MTANDNQIVVHIQVLFDQFRSVVHLWSKPQMSGFNNFVILKESQKDNSFEAILGRLLAFLQELAGTSLSGI